MPPVSGRNAGVAAAQQIAQALDIARARYGAGQLREAERICRGVIAQRPQHFAALNLLGRVMAGMGRIEEALGHFHAVATINPNSPIGHINEGTMLAALGRHPDAIACFDKAIALDPKSATALAHRGVALHASGRLQDALDSFDRALAMEPAETEIWTNRAATLHAMLRYEDALASADKALRRDPKNAGALANRGAALLSLDRNEEALESFERAQAIKPNSASLANSRGDALVALSRLDEAVASFNEASRLEPDNIAALLNRGNTLFILGQAEEAFACFRRVQELKPDLAEARLYEGMCRLAAGDYTQGWRQFESRWGLPVFRAARRQFAQPEWLGEADIAGKTILVHAEQGFGDTLQFCRYATLLARTATVILEVPRPLVRLLSTVAGVSRVIALDDPLPDFDAHCPMLSLPLACGTTVETIPGDVPYLRADPAQAASWRKRVSNLPGLKVGLVWSGAPRPGQPTANRIDRRRSTSLDRLAPIAQVPGVSLVSLQKGDAGAQARISASGIAIADWTEELDDFADTAALVEALDLVISVDTSVAHLVGALGKPVWVLNRHDACWRWLRDRTDSPWYPTARLFRQPVPGDWASVVTDVVTALRQLAG